MSRGRPERRRGIAAVRDLTETDIARLAAGERGSTPVVKSLRDSHHRIARMIASGMRLTDIAYATGFSIQRIYTLNSAPSVQELVETYRKDENESHRIARDDYYDLLYSNMVKAERQISDRLDQADEDGELLSIRELTSITRDAADRVGYGKRSLSVVANADFASTMERAVKRSDKVIELKPNPSPRRRI